MVTRIYCGFRNGKFDSSCPSTAFYLTTVHHNKEAEKDERDKVEPPLHELSLYIQY